MSNQNIIIASNGVSTMVMVDGKLYGDHIVKAEFVHDHTEKPNAARLRVTTDRLPLEVDTSDEERRAFMKRVEFLSELQKGEKEVEKLKALCQPIVEWLEKNHDPYTQVQITSDNIELVQKTVGIPLKQDG